MVSMHDVDTNELIKSLAEALKKTENIKIPEWAMFVKTGQAKERLPLQPDWWFHRTAAILRTVAIKGPIGINKLKIKFGSKKDRGHKPEIFKKASGKILRSILQQLDKEGLTKFDEKGVHKGRVITPKGQSLLDKIIKRK